ncbi:hypothetical protein Tco_1367385 [Tanacetum coccineum]
MAGLSTDRVALDEYMGVWFRSEVSEAVEVRSMGISFCTELQEKIASRRHVIQHLKKVGATSGWLMRLNRDQQDDVSLLRLLDTFVHKMYEIVRKKEKDGTYQNWLSRFSKPSPRTNEFGDWVKLSDPKQALRGRHPMLIRRLSRIFEASRARGFVLRSQELQILSFIWEIQYPNLIDKRLSLSILNKRLRIYIETLLKTLRTMFNSSMGGSIDLIVPAAVVFT